MLIDIYIQPNAKKSGFVGMHDGVIKLKISSPPVDNAANIEVCKYISDTLNLPKSSVEIVSGAKSRRKRLNIITDLTDIEVKKLLTKYT